MGEWAEVAPDIPRALIARSLKWDSYLERAGSRRGPLPVRSLAIEPLEKVYHELLQQESEISFLEPPIVSKVPPAPDLPPGQYRWLAIHSGDTEEQRILLDLARQKMAEYGHRQQEVSLETVFPGRGIFPVHDLLRSYTHIVSGAGYNMTAQALLCREHRDHILFPFERKFDDQPARVRLFQSGAWCKPVTSGAKQAAEWIKRSA
ncbi:MAG: hypothetical protein GY940_13155 [bacterium]|nr:hypothetical protein [bacterium]